VADFIDEDLTGSRFERVDFTDAQFKAVDFSGVVMRNVDLINVDIYGDVKNLRINDVDVGPFIVAELDKRYPLRVKMRAIDPSGFVEAWDIVERLWDETVGRARALPPELLHVPVKGEWTFIETLRHLVFATDSWINRALLGNPAPWDPLGLPWDEAPDDLGLPRDRDTLPSLDEVLELRRGRMSTVRAVIESLTPSSLDEETVPVAAPGWPPSRSFTTRKCLLIILNEEWEHRRYAERDLATLETRGA
jgi:DinB superfamily/Pentapeptide repeats (8 copies)